MRRRFKIKAKSVWTQRKRKLLEDALHYAFWEMDLYKLDVFIDFRLVRTPYAPGACTDAETKYIVHIDGTQDEQDIVETLFHELQHVVQYALGYLQDEENKVYWLGHWYSGDYQDTTTSDYWDAPWEVEAREVAWRMSENYYQS